MKRYMELVEEARQEVQEVLPWDLADELEEGRRPLLLDVREPYEFAAMHVTGSLNVPRGILELACEPDYDETDERLVGARGEDIVVICRSGHRSVLAAKVMQDLGFERVRSLKTGVRGWNEYEQPLVDGEGRSVSIDEADEYFMPLDQKRAMARLREAGS